MQFINDRLSPIATSKDNSISQGSGIDNLAGLSDIVRLKARCRIGDNHVTIDSKLVACADMRGRAKRLVPAVPVFRQPPRQLAAFEQFDGLGGGSPEIEGDAVRRNERAVSAWLVRNAENFDQRFLVFFLRPVFFL